MSNLIKMLNVLRNCEIWISENKYGEFHVLYDQGYLTLIDGTVNEYSFRKTELTNEYLKHKREVYTGHPRKGYTDDWATHQYCTFGSLKFKDEWILILTLKEGDSYDGHPTTIRWRGNFKVSSEALESFRHSIESKFNDFVDREFEKEEKIRIQRRKSKIRRMLLS